MRARAAWSPLVLAVAAGCGPAAPAPAARPVVPAWLDTALALEARVADLLGRLSLDEKAAQLRYDAPAVPRLGIPAYNWWNESLHGVARAGRATVFPQPIGLAATFDPALVVRAAEATGTEARAKHHEAARRGRRGIYEGLTFFAPNINIVRDPRWGRGMETFGEDPFLAGLLAAAFVRGMQGDDPRWLRTVATPKHFAVHSGPEPDRHGFDAVVDERDLRTTYLPAFEAAVAEGGAASVMCAYNRVRGDPACASPMLLGRVLRGEWRFGGYVVSDCWAVSDIHQFHRVAADEVEAAAMSLRAGTDLTCGPEFRSLPEAVRRGLVTEAAVDTALARLLRARFRLGMFDPPERVPYTATPLGVLDDPAHAALALEAARRSIVLLKNGGGLLPLRGTLRTIAVIGPNADDADLLLGNYNGQPGATVTPLEGIRRAAGAARVLFARGSDVAPGMPALRTVPSSALRTLRGQYFANRRFEGAPAVVRADTAVDFTWWTDAPAPGAPADSFGVRWTATLVAPVTGRYVVGVRAFGAAKLWLGDSLVLEHADRHVVWTQSVPVDLAAGEARALRLEYTDTRADAIVQLAWAVPEPRLLEEAVEAARRADVAVVFLGLSPRLEGEEMPVQVPGFAGGDRTTLDLPAPQDSLLRAVVRTGTPVVLVLLSGSAVAVNWAADSVPAILQAWYPGQAAGTAIADVLFGRVSPSGRLPVTFYRSASDLPPFADYRMEGRTYRYFRGAPLFPFGHGLSYARFRYHDLRLPARVRSDESVTASVEVENAGSVTADEVVQLYVSHEAVRVPVPLRSLAGIRRVTLRPGERRRVSFAVAPRQLAVVTDDGRIVVEPGFVTVAVGGKQPGQRGPGDAATTDVVSGRIEVVGAAPR
jgi:beta-glucosidase